MRRSIIRKKAHDPRPELIIHRDISGKAFALLVIFALSIGAFYFALRIPPAEGQRSVVDAVGADGETLYAALPRESGEVKVRGLDYLVPRKTHSRTRPGSVLDFLSENGLLRGYSVPPRCLSITPDGKAVILPPSPAVKGPRGIAVIFNGRRDSKRVALTFDTSEVSEPITSRNIIEELTRLRAPATFFVCGGWCVKNPELLRLATARGFEIANHSYSHPMFTRIPDEQIVNEIRGTEREVEKISGSEIAAYFRPPYGDNDGRVQQQVAQLGYATVIWDKDTLDWSPATVGPEIKDRATIGIRGGDIVLMHTNGKYTSKTLREVVTTLRAAGFDLTTLSGVLQP